MFEYDFFCKSLAPLGVEDARDTFEMLRSSYTEPGRYYHDTSHVSECLTNFQSYRSLAEHPEEVEIAFWFHDAIYDTTAPDNEEKSAELAERFLGSRNADAGAISRIADMILATKTHEVTSADSKLMVDIDLGILGTPEPVFEEYDRSIRREFEWVPQDLYIPARIQVLKSFLDRDVIYHTRQIHELLDTKARENLFQKVSQLTALQPVDGEA